MDPAVPHRLGRDVGVGERLREWAGVDRAVLTVGQSYAL